MQATSIAASAMPTIGKSNSSRAPPRPGSPNAAQTAASKVPRFSASISSMTALPIAASARVAMYGTPRGAVIGISSVPGLATSRPDATSRSVTPVEVLGLAIRIFIANVCHYPCLAEELSIDRALVGLRTLGRASVHRGPPRAPSVPVCALATMASPSARVRRPPASTTLPSTITVSTSWPEALCTSTP